MEELFRFTITRPAERTNAATIPLERSSQFQEELVCQAAELVSQAAEHVWKLLEKTSLIYIQDNLPWIITLIGQTPVAPVPVLKQLLSDLQAVQAGSSPNTWQAPIQTAVAKIRPDQLEETNGKLADLFLALLILRSIGPTEIDKLIRSRNLAVPGSNPCLTPNLPPHFAEVLHDRPSLNDIADLLRMLDLVMNAPLILSAASPIKTVDDLQAALKKTLLLPPGIFSRFEKPVHAIGVTELFVVKQHIARYEMGEIARIENILKGESRDHSQKHTLSNERDTVLDTSTETQTDQELTSTDHVSLQNEIESTLKEDTKIDAGVHVQYDGGSVKAQADLTVGYDRASSDSKKFASNIAKDITQKAAKKVTQKVQQIVTTKIIETFEETHDQTFDNKSGVANISGVYQWVEKVYLAQMFQYGKHLLFDIMVPEPAASLLQVATNPPSDQTMPVQPGPLGTITIDGNGKMILDPLSPDQLVEDPHDPNFYGKWVAKFQVGGVEAPPSETITVAKSFSENPTGSNVHLSENITIDDGYAAYTCSISVAWRRNDGEYSDQTRIDVIVGPKLFYWTLDTVAGGDRAARNLAASVQEVWLKQEPDANGVMQTIPLEERSIGVALEGTFCETAAANIEVQCKRTEKGFAKWQFQTYEKIVAAWQKLQADYEEKVSALQFQKGTTGPLGAADPETNRQIERTELKRSCIALLANSNEFTNGCFDALVPKTPKPPNPPPDLDSLFAPDLAVAETRGSWVRWFEQAFEWDKIGYVFYPYYWGRASEWVRRLDWKNDDPLFLNFLQAGYARVVIPVRNGFECAINFFVHMGKPWLGGGLPEIWDQDQNPLYLSITDEMKEQTGAPGDEKPYEQPWEIRLPTTLIRLRDDDKLPKWKWDPPGTYPPSPPSLWTWEEDKASEQNDSISALSERRESVKGRHVVVRP